MQNSWKHKVAAGAVSAASLAALGFLLAMYRYNRPRSVALARAANSFDYYTGGRHAGSLLTAYIFIGIVYAAIMIVPYELTLRILRSGRLRGED